MIAVETNIGSPEIRSTRPALELRFEFVDGSKENFIQNDTKKAKLILQRINPSSQFEKARWPPCLSHEGNAGETACRKPVVYAAVSFEGSPGRSSAARRRKYFKPGQPHWLYGLSRRPRNPSG